MNECSGGDATIAMRSAAGVHHHGLDRAAKSSTRTNIGHQSMAGHSKLTRHGWRRGSNWEGTNSGKGTCGSHVEL